MKLRIFYRSVSVHSSLDGCFVEAGEILTYHVLGDEGEILGVGKTEDEARNQAQVGILKKELERLGLI